MTRREVGFLLIGLSVGLMLSIAATLEILLFLYRSALVTAYDWDKVMLLIGFFLLVIGLFLILYRSENKPDIG